MNVPTEYSFQCHRPIAVTQERVDSLLATEKQYARLINTLGVLHANFSSVELAGLFDVGTIITGYHAKETA